VGHHNHSVCECSKQGLAFLEPELWRATALFG
jgi:hypothetical protein